METAVSLFAEKYPNQFHLHKDLTSVRDVHQLFLNEYQLQVSEAVYRSIFNTYNIGFSLPHTDTWDEFLHKIKITSDINEKKNCLKQLAKRT